MTKVISISDEAYEKLAAIKDRNESFSKAVVRLVSKSNKRSILEFAGKWSGDIKEADKIFKKIAEDRFLTKIRKTGL
ncbi:MAG: antitoxin VapB family protein [Candidatus Aenigmarchaeota archaeon]|nr:antitoxin VapB family protein [Candidatus Aenigmarchaeota archaeon]